MAVAAADAARRDRAGAGRQRRAAVQELRALGRPLRTSSWPNFIAALIGAIFIQIGTNLANDYSDAKRGADTVDRLGPVRVTAAGLVAPRAGPPRHLGGLRRSPPSPACTWRSRSARRSSLIGILSIAAGVLYTGGPKPYGYEGLGEVFVFVFFGLVAVNGSFYVQLEELELAAGPALDPDRPALGGDPRRQQRPRHRHRPPRRQADARGAAGPRAHAASSTP